MKALKKSIKKSELAEKFTSLEVECDASLKEYSNKIMFPEKIEKMKETLNKFGLPKFSRTV
jgi:hypothetical protein